MHKPPLVIRLEKIGDRDAALVGSKALSLARMHRMHLNVPAGFCITTAAFSTHIDTASAASPVCRALEKLDGTKIADGDAILSDLRRDICATELGTELYDQIADHYERVCHDPVAVRSSATAEDLPSHSFAGQYETFLGIKTLEELIEAVKGCWAAIWTHRAHEYRRANSIAHLDVQMAVIVQKLIDADASGVLFTIDPATSKPDRVVIESCFGLGETLVSGKVTPDCFHVGRRTRWLLRQTISTKTIETILDKDHSITERHIGADRASSPSISEATVRQLAQMGLKLEKKLGSPQDVEWAIREGRIFLLQSRPVTTIKERSWEDRQIWTNANLHEVVPDPLTPMTWSLMERFAEIVFGPMMRLSCLRASPLQFVGFVGGRLYWNINAGMSAIMHLPRWKEMNWSDAFGGDSERWRDLADTPDEDLPDLRASLLKTILRAPLSLWELYGCRQKKGFEAIAHIEDIAGELRQLELEPLSESQITMRLYDALDELYLTMNILYAFVALGAMPVLDYLYDRWLGDKDAPPLARLLAGIQGMDSAQAGLDLWKLAATANDLPAVRDAILCADDFRQFRGSIADGQQADDFFAAYDGFIALHGHHCRSELELANPRWSERPDYILRQLKGYLKNIDRTDPPQNYEQLIEQRKEALRECERLLKNPIKRRLLRYLVGKSQRGCVLRENFKSTVVRLLAGSRRILLELARRFHERGILESPDDIFFLRMDDLGPLANGEVPDDLQETIKARRTEHERNVPLNPSSLVFGKFDPSTQTREAFDGDITTLRGMGTSDGVITGPARVILHADDNEQVNAGEILVAPFTDPGWTPYFVPAAGIVMEQGGHLSHGSVIAREYGLPAVVNVPHATRIIKTGQKIQIDGSEGTVRILQ